MSQNILLMTATITPPSGVPELSRVNPALRLHDYGKALEFYLPLLNRCIDKIIFVENSNSDIHSLQAIVDRYGHNQEVEFIVFYGLDHPPQYGRAYGEFKLIDYAMENSTIIKNCYPDATVWKVTGRYIIRNIPKIIARKPTNFDVYCNFRTVPKPWADMFLMGWSLDGYHQFIKGIYSKLMSSYDVSPLHPEEVFIHLLSDHAGKINLKRRINPAPVIDGIRGSDSQNYLAGKNRLKTYARLAGRILLPWLWI